jgi:hypothetical protein
MPQTGRGFRWKTTRLYALCLIVGCLCDPAEACVVASSQTGVLFDHIPEGSNAPVIVEVTIVSREADIRSPDHHTRLAVMNARVERVVRGTVDSDALKVVTYLGSCTRIGVGHGFVAGTLDHDAQLGLELIAIQRSYEILTQRR